MTRWTRSAYAADDSRGSSGAKRAKRWNCPTARAIRKHRLQYMSGWPRWWMRLSLRNAKVSTPNPSDGPGRGRQGEHRGRFYRDSRARIRLCYGRRPEAATGGIRSLTAVLLLYALTLFAGATLLFVMQPMVGKMILPLLGGTPAVWSTCMVFFQAALLGGYAYAHALHRAPAALAPGAPAPGRPRACRSRSCRSAVNPRLLRGGEANPVLDVLTLLSLSVGLPFLVVSATAPLLQKWFTHTGHPAARDPYFLYAASNLGSMLALLGYPTLVEPRLHLQGPSWLTQTTLWSVGYGVLAVLTALCALTLWWKPAAAPAPAAAEAEAAPDAAAERGARLGGGGSTGSRWPSCPRACCSASTTYITTDLAAVPLLWVLPLAIYLLTFILAFGRWPRLLHRAGGARSRCPSSSS